MDLSTHIHGMVVHFPIALLVASFALEIVALFARTEREAFQFAGLCTLLLGTAGAALSVITGPERNLRASALGHPHENWAHITLIIFGLLAIFRLFLAFRKQSLRALPLIAYLLVALVGLGALGYTGYLGGQMVYEDAVGVRHNGQEVNPAPARPFPRQPR